MQYMSLYIIYIHPPHTYNGTLFSPKNRISFSFVAHTKTEPEGAMVSGMSQNKYMFSFRWGLESWSIYSAKTNPANYSRVNYLHRDDIYVNLTLKRGRRPRISCSSSLLNSVRVELWLFLKRRVLPAVWMGVCTMGEQSVLWAWTLRAASPWARTFSSFFHPTTALLALPEFAIAAL